MYLLDLSNKHCACFVSLWYMAIIRERSPEQCVVKTELPVIFLELVFVTGQTEGEYKFFAYLLNKMFILCKLFSFSDDVARADLRKLPVLPTRTLKERPSITYW